MDDKPAGSSTSEAPAEETEETYNMQDILKSQDEMMEQVAAVLGAGDDFNCTYAEGYLKRQALYACLTCIPEAKDDYNKSAGVCLACSYHCHDGHNLVELYTKRNFRCDCGNKKFNNFTCNLNANKDDYNVDNRYNQNFSGVYCVCSKPYPDPEDTVDDEMTQCIVCEDWYHSRHLNTAIPSNYDEMICVNCIERHDFLLHYDGLTLTAVTQANTSGSVDVEGVEGEKKENAEVGAAEEKEESTVATNGEEGGGKSNGTTSPVVNGEKSEANASNPDCTKPKAKSTNVCTKFMEDVSWRQKLCRCADCMKMYEEQKVLFLLDAGDTVHCYEDKGKQKFKEISDQNIQKQETLLNSMDRVSLMEFLAGYNDMKEQLVEFLKTFAEKKQVLKEEDVKEFFSELRAKKRQKISIPYHCR